MGVDKLNIWLTLAKKLTFEDRECEATSEAMTVAEEVVSAWDVCLLTLRFSLASSWNKKLIKILTSLNANLRLKTVIMIKKFPPKKLLVL